MRDILAELLHHEQTKRGIVNQQKAKAFQHGQKQYSQRGGQRCNRTVPKMHIRIALFITLSLCAFSGCQKSSLPYGNFAGADSVELIQDAANALYAAYPPAKTRLVLLQPTEDAFGLSLVESLRGGGYAVAEYAPPEKGGVPVVGADAGLGFGYVLDRLQDGDGMRVTLHVGDETLSRLYRIQGAEGDARYIPAGFWVRREGRKHSLL
jgi:hypothetical protein